MTAEDINKL